MGKGSVFRADNSTPFTAVPLSSTVQLCQGGGGGLGLAKLLASLAVCRIKAQEEQSV